MLKKLALCLIFLLMFPAMVWSVEIYRDGDVSLDAGFWGQAWYQYVQNYDTDGGGEYNDSLNDFMTRRAYFYVKGELTPWFGFFVHYAGDKLGMDDVDNPSEGLGSGLALRDGWVTVKLWDDAAKLQLGRMYVPLTRNYGTTSTKTLLTTDLDWTQGGLRGKIFYPSKVGRDDGACLWGNVMNDMVQYRLMVSEGVEDAKNPDDNLRFVGRVSVNLLETEKGWFNQGTYLGKKEVLAIGLGGDYQANLKFGTEERDYSAWTVDLFYDQPMGGGALTVEAAYIDISHTPSGVGWTQCGVGDDLNIISAKLGYLFPGTVGPGQIQPFAHHEYVKVDEEGADDTRIYGAGLNYFIKGHANKVSLDVMYMDQEEEIGTSSIQDRVLFTLQLAAGF